MLHTDINMNMLLDDDCDHQMWNAWVVTGLVFKQQSFYTFMPIDLLFFAM
jgi:hypothetical protein